MASERSIRGQIASIQLKNFMSYDEIKLSPGPHLNFIIGPNGTGKSTFVCAVVLGLGGKLKSLGRADSLTSFLKTGTKEGHIIIELCDPAEGNIRIKRVITSTNSSEFYVNDSRATASKISEIREFYNIQLDNLCTFLPQEKVQDFARLNPQELLCQTQIIAGDGGMTDNYNQLKELKATVTDYEKHISSLQKQLEEKKQKNERIKGRVQTFMESRALCQRLTHLKQKRAWYAYFKEASKYTAADRKFLSIQRIFKLKRKRHRRLSNIVEQMQKKLIKMEKESKELKQEYTKKKFEIENELKNFSDKVYFMEEFNIIVEEEVGEEQQKKSEADVQKEKLDKLKNDLSTFQEENGTVEELKLRIKEMNTKIETNMADETQLTSEKTQLEDLVSQMKYDLENTTVELRILEKRRDFRLEYLKRYEPDIYKSVEWLDENRQLFRGRIYNPMLLELDVTDVKYAKYIEARIPYRDLIAFTCTDVDDMNLLIRTLRTEFGYKVNAVSIEDHDTEEYKEIGMTEAMFSLGFFVFMKSLLTGPKDIIRYLCKMYRIHKVPIGNELVEKNCDNVPNEFMVFFSDKRMFTVKFSEYSGEKSITVRQISEPKFFTVPLGSLKMKELTEKKNQLEAQLADKEKSLQSITCTLNAVVTEKEGLNQKKRKMVMLVNENEAISCKIKLMEEKVNEFTWKEPVTVLNEMVQQREELRLKLLDSTVEVKDLYLKLSEQTRKLQVFEIERRVNREKLYGYIEKRDQTFKKLSSLRDRLRSLQATKAEIKGNRDCLESEARNLTDGIGPLETGFCKYEQIFSSLKNTVEELDEEIRQVQITTELLCAGDVEMLHEYEEREREISTLTTDLNIARAKLEHTMGDMASIRHSWFGPLSDLVGRINTTFGEFFRNMNCTGIVSISRGEDENNVEEYGITIKVQFRSEMPLQELGRHFQSGGERAITTAVYLLSLQKLMNAPFRFVDEINQGMDATNERRMIELMIRETNSENSNQYFFITPKLLPDIKCSDKLAIHCVFGGENAVPSNSWNLDSFLSRM